MALPGHLTLPRLFAVVAGSPLLGGFVWGAIDVPGDWDNLPGRFFHGVLAAPITFFVMFARPEKLQWGWLCVAGAFVMLLTLAIRVPPDRRRASR